MPAEGELVPEGLATLRAAVARGEPMDALQVAAHVVSVSGLVVAQAARQLALPSPRGVSLGHIRCQGHSYGEPTASP